MMKFIVVDSRKTFLDDINTRLLLDDERNIDVVSTLTSAGNLHNAISAYKPDVVAVCENIVETQSDWDYADAEIVGYAVTDEGEDVFRRYNLPCYGKVRNTTHLLNLMEGPIPSNKSNKKQEKNETVNSEPDTEAAKVDSHDISAREIMPEVKQDKAYKDTVIAELDEEITEKLNTPTNTETNPIREPATKMSQIEMLRQQKKATHFGHTEEEANEHLNNDIYKRKLPAKVVTVYSSKGGVGKTTLSTEIASYLALTEHGRGRYRVCIADYNIDFGDVRATLGLNNDDADMTLWAMDIRDRIQNGEKPEDIQYSKKEIESYLQIADKIGLYALCAPNTHEESMDIGQNELEVMLRNLIHNGGFDYVVCDTGNNTRDSSFCALEMADHVFLVVTQDVNAASCNKSVLETFGAIGFDMSKISLIINKIMPVKYTGVQPKDIEDYFEKYPCVARVKNDMDLIKTNNLSEPIVLQPNHDVTKELRKIIAFLTGDKEASVVQQKNGFLSRLFKR